MSMKGTGPSDKTQFRTSIDLELDLHASHAKLEQLNEEIQRLRDIKNRMEEAKANG